MQRLEFIGKTKAKIMDVKPFAIKAGQKDSITAIQIKMVATVSNEVFAQLDPALRKLLYEKAPQGAKAQKQLEGVQVVTDLPMLSQTGLKLGRLKWGGEQTGCKLKVDYGLGGTRSDQLFKDTTIKAISLDPKEGGTTMVYFTAVSPDVQHGTFDDMALMYKRETLIELEAPTVAPVQQTIGEDEGGLQDAGEELTPQKALAKALQQNHEGKPVTVKPPAKKAAAKKPAGKAGNSKLGRAIGRHAAKTARGGKKAKA
jgi:hypothetical protein